MKFFSIVFLLTIISLTSEAQVPKDVVSQDGFILKSTIWEQSDKSPLAILLHQCDADQTMYENIAGSLHEAGFHVITIDNRGIGKSISEDYDIVNAENRGREWGKINAQTENDLEAIISFVKEQFANRIESYAIMGASCAGIKALYLIEKLKNDVLGYAILSARMSEMQRNKFGEIAEIPGLFIAAGGDKRAYDTAVEGRKLSQSDKSELFKYSGRHHANQLFKIDRNLEWRIARWFTNLRLP